MSDSPKRTLDGFEVHMGINFLGHYALTRRLLKLMRSTAKITTDGVRFGLKRTPKPGSLRSTTNVKARIDDTQGIQ